MELVPISNYNAATGQQAAQVINDGQVGDPNLACPSTNINMDDDGQPEDEADRKDDTIKSNSLHRYVCCGRNYYYDIVSLAYGEWLAVQGIGGYIMDQDLLYLLLNLIFAPIIFIGTYLEYRYKTHYPLLAATITLATTYLSIAWFGSNKNFFGDFLLALIMATRYAIWAYNGRHRESI